MSDSVAEVLYLSPTTKVSCLQGEEELEERGLSTVVTPLTRYFYGPHRNVIYFIIPVKLLKDLFMYLN